MKVLCKIAGVLQIAEHFQLLWQPNHEIHKYLQIALNTQDREMLCHYIGLYKQDWEML
jgi:hypothetical protein